MRKLLFAAVAGATVLSGSMVASAVSAQPVGSSQPGFRYDADGRRFVDYGYRARGYYGDAPFYGDEPPYDRFGADPNGMIAPDGHRIKCKLQNNYDERTGRFLTRRICD